MDKPGTPISALGRTDIDDWAEPTTGAIAPPLANIDPSPVLSTENVPGGPSSCFVSIPLVGSGGFAGAGADETEELVQQGTDNKQGRIPDNWAIFDFVVDIVANAATLPP
jgi:hypothetical protein